MTNHASISFVRGAAVLLTALASSGSVSADVRWADSPAFAVNAIPDIGGIAWASSSAINMNVTRVARGSADSNSFGIDSPAPPPDQPRGGHSAPTIEVNLDRLRVWDPQLRRFVNPRGPITINLLQPTYLLTHGWDDTLGPQPIDDCPSGSYEYGMTSIALAIADELDSNNDGVPEANLLGWEWGDCRRGSNPNCEQDVNNTLWSIAALFGAGPRGPQYQDLRRVVNNVRAALRDADESGDNAGAQGALLARALVRVIRDQGISSLGSSLHFIGHSHGGGLLARAAEMLYNSNTGVTVDSLSLLDTPRWGVIDSMAFLEDPSKVGHVTIYYGDGDLLTGAFGQPYPRWTPNVTSIKLAPAHVHWPLHLGIRGADHEFTCSNYASWFSQAITGGVSFRGSLPLAVALDPRTMPAGKYVEGGVRGEFWPVGACLLSGPPPQTCLEVTEAECDILGGEFGGGGTTCDPGVRSEARDELRLLSFNGMDSAADWFGTGAVVASGSDPNDLTNIVVRIVDIGEASFFRDIAWPPAAYVLEFDYMFDEFAVDETLTVYSNDEIIYYDAANVTLARNGLRRSGLIPVSDFAGTTTRLSFVLRGDSEVGGMCLIDNLRIYALPAGDVDFDGDIDMDDAMRLLAVLNGPGVPQPPPGGTAEDFAGADFDEDGDVDLLDLKLMQEALR